MPTFYNSSGKSYELSVEIGRGGEGTVFYCPNDSALVAKIYHEPIDSEKEEKLRWMAANRNDHLLKVAAWIVDTLHDRAGNIVGFLMPNVKAKEIHELYSLKSRRVHFPEATWQFLIHSASNVARAFYVLHKNDHIMGDVNHGNCVVLADGTVKLIDCDSYSIKTDKMRYRCEVGVATHVAPELQGIDLGEVEREKKHDNFGLAVIIFQLLFLGRHPFAGNYLGAEDKSLEDCIREYRFAYWNEPVTRVKQPPGTLSLSQLSPRVADLFKQAFFTQERPEAREWIEALEDLSESLRQCSVHIGHHFFNGLVACPWCEIEAKTGLMLFPFVSGKEVDNEFNIFTIENLLASLDVPQNLPAKPVKPSVYPPPSPEATMISQRRLNSFVGLVVIELIVVLIFSISSPGCGFVFGILLMALFLAIRNSIDEGGLETLKNELANAQAGWEYFENEWRKYRDAQDLTFDTKAIRNKVETYHSLQQKRQLQNKQLTEATHQFQLTTYLQSFKLADAGLLDVEEEYLKAFERFGIKTAADFDETRLNSFAMKAETKDKLVRWRKDLESKFEFDANTQLPEATQNSFETEFADKRRKVEKEIEQMLVTLRSVSTKLRQQHRQLTAKATTVAQALVQAESNLAKAKNSVLMTLSLVAIPIFIPLFISMFQSPAPTYSSSNPPYAANGAVARPAASPVYSPTFYDPNYVVNENITDAEITEMSANERYKSAEALHTQALKLIEKNDLKQAERKLRLAIKFIDYDKEIIYTLSSLLYEQNRYQESLKFLEKSLKVDPENENTKLLMGANYLKMQLYDDAKTMFLSVANINPRSYEAHFNLGQVYKKTNYSELAVTSFEKAIEISSDDVEANYEYGLALYKVGRKSEARNQYEVLLDLDEAKAEKLRQIIKAPKIQNVGEGRGNGSGPAYRIDEEPPAVIKSTPAPTPLILRNPSLK